ncbi:MAG: ABC transporter substrate-binding protein [Woeseiaceae bacterium]
MRGMCFLAKQSRFGALVILALVFAGCATQTPVEDPDPIEPVVVVETPDPVIIEPEPEPEPEPVVEVPTEPSIPPIAIVLTSSQPAYLDVAVELAAHFEDHQVYDLSAESLPPISVLRSINDGNSTAVVAIGLRAAQSSVAMSDTPVVFSQVFNHQDHDLLKESTRGVAALAPLDAQLAAWKEVDPDMTRVGLIIGEGHDDLMADAEVAAARHGIELHIRVAHSDQETLYFFRRMIRDIDGFWLFPDNRILSARVLSQMLEDANRQRVPVVVPNDSMLKMGAAISITTVAADIAATIANIVRRIQAGDIDEVPAMTELSEVRIAVNEDAASEQAVATTSTTQ